MSIPNPVGSPPLPPPGPITKIATALPARERLRREAAALRRAAHPNVVRLASFVDVADRSELRIEHGGDQTLATAPPPDGSTALTVASSLAATLADLHRLGIVHGRLTADHVLIGVDGRALLCGLSETRPGDPASDVRVFATLLELLATGPPAPTTRRDRRAVATLLAVADRARTAEPAPPAEELARLLGANPSPSKATGSRPGPRPDRRWGIALAGAAVVVAVAATVTLLGDGSALPEMAAVTEAAPSTSAVRRATTTDPPAPEPPPPALAVAGATFEVGRDGDLVVTGDWDCDGVPGAALLRADDGALFVFDVLAAPGTPVPGRPLDGVDGATRLEAIPQPGGCDALVAHLADGRAQVVAVVPR